MKGIVLSLLLVLIASLAQASEITEIQKSTETALSVHSSARLWGLTGEEWSRYEQLRQSERGIWSPSLDPLTLLGVEATTDTERRRYADLLVEKEYQRVEKELAFQRAYDEAWKRRFPGVMPVSSTAPLSAPEQANRRLTVFVRESCPDCDFRLKALFLSQHPLDIYLVDSGGDDARLRRWAIAQRIDITRVRQRDITLNHDGGRWLQIGQGSMPAVLEQRGEAWLPVSAP